MEVEHLEEYHPDGQETHIAKVMEDYLDGEWGMLPQLHGDDHDVFVAIMWTVFSFMVLFMAPDMVYTKNGTINEAGKLNMVW